MVPHRRGSCQHASTWTTIELRKNLRALRGRSYRKERLGLDGSPHQNLPYDRIEQAWAVISEQTPGGIVDIPRLLTTTRTQFEREANPLAIIATNNTQWDAFGNVIETVETATTLAGPNQVHKMLRTKSRFGEDPTGRFLSRVWRLQQFDGADTLIADTITLYDNMQEALIVQGLVTKSSALAQRRAGDADLREQCARFCRIWLLSSSERRRLVDRSSDVWPLGGRDRITRAGHRSDGCVDQV